VAGVVVPGLFGGETESVDFPLTEVHA
jgi:hypothetical protein